MIIKSHPRAKIGTLRADFGGGLARAHIEDLAAEGDFRRFGGVLGRRNQVISGRRHPDPYRN